MFRITFRSCGSSSTGEASRRSGRRHCWAVSHALVEYEIGDDDSPRRWLLLGADGSGRILEWIVRIFDDGREMVIHAMAMRSKYQVVLEGWS
jgi:hypothetical protein